MKVLVDMAGALQAFGRTIKTRVTLAGSDARLIERSGLFDQTWYLARYPDVARRGYPPLVHYLRLGARQGRNPNRVFDTEWYWAQHPDLAQTGVNPLVDYIAQGGAAAPSPGFDPGWYRTQTPSFGGLDPLAHFLKVGSARGLLPRPPLKDFSQADATSGGQQWRIAIKIPAPSKSRNEWGEFHLAEGLRDSLQRLGHHVVIDFRDAWQARPAMSDDLVIVFRGAVAYEPNEAHFNVLWNISHPELVSPEECESYDLVYVSSLTYASRLQPCVSVPVRSLLQATDPSRFRMMPETERRPAAIRFVGNSRGVYRDIVRWAVAVGLEPEIYGKGWQSFVPPHLIKGEAVENRQLGALYADARVVLNDHWPSMRDAGFISNRVFDVVASGGALVSDAVPGIDEVFGEAVQQVHNTQDLPKAVERAAALSPQARAEAARLVGENHSFDVRARRIVADVAALGGTAAWKEHRKTRQQLADGEPRYRRGDGPSTIAGTPAPAFSIVVPVYNAARYLAECLESALRQRCQGGFEIIIVDDGSTDDSLPVAQRYRDAHPGIVTVLRQANLGASAARNTGVAIARGTFVNFLDADDRFGRQVLKRVQRFFEQHGDVVHIVTIPIVRFERQRGPHPLNAKFRHGSRIIDLDEEPDAVLRHTTSSFIRRTALPARPFNEAVHYGEDAELILRLLMERRRYGVVCNARLLKRSRRDRSSLVDRLYDDRGNLFQVAHWHRRLIEDFVRRFGAVPPFVQASLLYDYQWQARSPRFGFALRTSAERAAYMADVGAVLAHVDPERIRVARHVNAAERILLAELRDGSPSAALPSGATEWELPSVEVLFIELGEQLTIEGKAFALGGGSLRVTVNGRPMKVGRNPPLDSPVLFFGEDVQRYTGFRITLPLGTARLAFAWEGNGGTVTPLRIAYGTHCGLAVQGSRHQGILGGLGFLGDRDTLTVAPLSALQRLWREARYLAHLVGRLRLRQAGLRLLAHAVAPGATAATTVIFLDRAEGAGDNAEHLFRYVREHHGAGERRLFFAVTPSSPDFSRLEKIGNVIAYGSLRHRIEMFRADIVVSSHGNPPTFNPFGRDERFLRDLLRFKRAFVSHGVMNTSQCQWCGREAINLSLFTTTTRSEYETMLAAPIGYTEKQIRLTGMPRYDRLTPGPGDAIVLMPTWRKGLLDRLAQLATFKEKVAGFAASDFAREWRAIAGSDEIAQLKCRRGLKVVLVWHPAIYNAFRRWPGATNGLIEEALGRETTDFERLKTGGGLLVTDYSSISFDFAYLGKPIAYYQFDADRMLNDRTYHRYIPDFDFAERGFGPVIKNRDKLVQWIVETSGREMMMAEPYAGRANGFFQFRDRENCRRVWEEILRIEGPRHPAGGGSVAPTARS